MLDRYLAVLAILGCAARRRLVEIGGRAMFLGRIDAAAPLGAASPIA